MTLLSANQNAYIFRANDNKLYHVQGYYNFEKRNHPNGKGGGVALYVKAMNENFKQLVARNDCNKRQR